MKKTNTIAHRILLMGLVIFAGISAIYAQKGNGKITTKEHTVSAFKGIEIGGNYDVKLLQGAQQSVKVETDEDLQQFISFEVKNDILRINSDKDLKNATKLNIFITFQNIASIKGTGAANIKADSTLKTDKLSITLSGAADADLKVEVKELKTDLSGSGDLQIAGIADTHRVEISGAGDLKAFDLKTKTTSFNVSGAGNAKINAIDEIKGEISGAGDVVYLSEPAIKNVTVDGAGDFGLAKDKDKKSYSELEDTTRVKIGDNKLLIIKEKGKKRYEFETDEDSKHPMHKKKHKEKEFEIYWAGVGVGVNGLLNNNNKPGFPAGYDYLDLDYGKSASVSINIFEQHIPILKKNINIVTGFGVESNNYRFTDNYLIGTNNSFTSFIKDTVKYSKNKLEVTYLNVPLMVQFDSPKIHNGRTIHVSGGMMVGYKVESHTKHIYETNGQTFKPKTHDDFNISPFKYSVVARAGYGKVDLFASYALNSLFKEDKGPQAYPFTVGINVVGF